MTLRVTVPAGVDPTVYVMGKKGAPSLLAARARALKAQFESETTLSPREREGIRFRLAQMVGCTHCLKIRMARDMPGFSSEPIPEDFYSNVLAYRGWSGYTERERLAIEFAERFALDPDGLRDDDAYWQRAQAQFDEHEIGDLCVLTGTWVASGWTMKVLGLASLCDADLHEGGPRPRKVDALNHSIRTIRTNDHGRHGTG